MLCREKLCDVYAHDSTPVSPRIRACQFDALPTKPLRMYSPDEVSNLLHRLGAPSSDACLLRRRCVDGAALPGLTESCMELDMLLTPAGICSVRMAQRAARLWSRLSRSSSAARITELDLRTWLATVGLRSSVISRLASAFRELTAPECDGVVSFGELALGFEWFDCKLRAAGAYL